MAYVNPIWDDETRAIVRASWGQVPAYEIAARVNAVMARRSPDMPFCPRCRTGYVGQRKDGLWRCRNCEMLFPKPVIGGGQLVTSPTGSGVVQCAYYLHLIKAADHERERQRALRAWYKYIGSEPVSEALRRQILARDGYKCRRCGGTEELEVDHIIPRVRGGRSIPENLQTLCGYCNWQKGGSTAHLRDYVRPEDSCPCGSGKPFAECCGRKGCPGSNE